MHSFWQWAQNSVTKLNVVDIGMLKILLLLIGTVIGAYFPKFIKKYLIIIVPVIVILWAYLIWKVFR